MKAVYLIDGRRTPQAKAGNELKNVPPPYLGSCLIRRIMDELALPDDVIDQVIIGNTGNPPKYPNLGRVIALQAGLNKKTIGHTVNRNCASGMEAVAEGWLNIHAGRSQLIFAGGLESMSQMPLLYGKEMTKLLSKLMRAKTVTERLALLIQFRVHFLKPVVAIKEGLTDPFCNLSMGQTAELLAREFNISREAQDEFAHNSHLKAVNAQKEGKFDAEIIPVEIGAKLEKLLGQDKGPRSNSSLESLAKLKPFFERKSGTVTIGNSCPLTDGGAMTLLASEDAVKEFKLNPMARIVDYHFHGLEPDRMGIGPLLATEGVLQRAKLTLKDIDLVEINEAFAAQILALKLVFKEKSLAQRFGLENALGEIPEEKLNVNGGAIALGHPVGATGTRLVVSLAHELKKRKQKYGLASLCIGGGQGGAIILENLL